MTTGPGETVVQTAGETRFVVDCNANPVALVGNAKMSFALGPVGSGPFMALVELDVATARPAATPSR